MVLKLIAHPNASIYELDNNRRTTIIKDSDGNFAILLERQLEPGEVVVDNGYVKIENNNVVTTILLSEEALSCVVSGFLRLQGMPTEEVRIA